MKKLYKKIKTKLYMNHFLQSGGHGRGSLAPWNLPQNFPPPDQTAIKIHQI